jgi:predicted amidohydrolase YtcJ
MGKYVRAEIGEHHKRYADPKDGAIQRDANGRATGILLETAMGLVSAAVPESSIPEIAAAIEKAQPVLWRMGITAFTILTAANPSWHCNRYMPRTN